MDTQTKAPTAAEITAAASERAGYRPETWATAHEVVTAALEIEREKYEHSARVLFDNLADGTDLDGVLRFAGFLLADLGITEGIER